MTTAKCFLLVFEVFANMYSVYQQTAGQKIYCYCRDFSSSGYVDWKPIFLFILYFY